MWQRIKDFFSDSETIFWARLHVLLGFICAAITAIDPSLLQPLFGPWTFIAYLAVNGLATEYLRRRRDDQLAAPASEPDWDV